MNSYFIVFFIILFSAKYLVAKNSINKICFFILFIFSAIRFDIGSDFRWYYNLAVKNNYLEYNFFISAKEVIEKAKILNEIDLWFLWQYLRIEFFNKILYRIVWYLEFPQLIVIFYSFIILFFIKKGLEDKRIYNYNSWIFFYTFPLFYFQTLTIMRQWCAIAIIFYSYKYIENKKIFKFIICVIVASLFHETAIFLIIIYFLQYVIIDKKIHLLIFLLSFFSLKIIKSVFLLNLPVISKYKVYFLTSLGEGGKVIYYLVILLYLGILIISYLDNNFYIKNRLIITYVCIGCFIYISVIDLGHLGPRMSQFFLIFIIYIFDDIERSLKNKLKIAKKYLLICEFILLFLFLYADKCREDRSLYVPYKIFLLSEREEVLYCE